MFRYSGSKKRLIKHLPAPPAGTHTIVEPFAGSAAYGLHYRPRLLLLAEANEDVAALWRWLIEEATAEELLAVQDKLRDFKTKGEKFDLREAGLSPGALTLARLTTSGVYVGQLSSWVFYPQHGINFSDLLECLGYIKRSVRLIGQDFEVVKQCDPEAFVFVDPPYLGTSANYIDKGKGKNHDKIELRGRLVQTLNSIPNSVLFTYGDDAVETFPEYEWQLAVERRVPKIRTGGTKLRREWFSQIRTRQD